MKNVNYTRDLTFGQGDAIKINRIAVQKDLFQMALLLAQIWFIVLILLRSTTIRDLEIDGIVVLRGASTTLVSIIIQVKIRVAAV